MDIETYELKVDEEGNLEERTTNSASSEGKLSMSYLDLLANPATIPPPVETIKKPSPRAPKTKSKSKSKSVSPKAVNSLSSVNSTETETTDTYIEEKRQKKRLALIKKENRNIGIRGEKNDFLCKLNKVSDRRITNVKFSVEENTLDEIKYEFERVKTEIASVRGVDFMKRMMLLGVQGMEMLNNRFDFMDLDGWTESFGYSLESQEYDEVMSELYYKYKGVGNMSPEFKLMFMIVSSAAMFSISKRITKIDPSTLMNSLFNGGGVKQSMPSETETMSTVDDTPSKIRKPSVDDDEISAILEKMKKNANANGPTPVGGITPISKPLRKSKKQK